MIQALLNHGADPSKRNEEGKRPLDVCKEAEIACLLDAVIQNNALCLYPEVDEGYKGGRQSAATEGSPADGCPSSSAIRDGGEGLPTPSSRVKEGEEVRSVLPIVSSVEEGGDMLSASSKDEERDDMPILSTISGIKEEGEAPTSSMIQEEVEAVMLGVPTSSCGKNEEEDVISGVPTSSCGKDEEDVMLGVPTLSCGKEDEEEEAVMLGVPTSSCGKDEEEEEEVMSGVPTSSCGKDEEEKMEVVFEPSNDKGEEEEEDLESALPSSSVEDVLLSLSSDNLEGREKGGNTVSGLPTPSSAKEEEEDVCPSSSSREEGVLPLTPAGMQGKVSPSLSKDVPASHSTSACTLSLSLGGIRVGVASSKAFAEMEEPSSTSADQRTLFTSADQRTLFTSADQRTLSANGNVRTTEQEKKKGEGREEEEEGREEEEEGREEEDEGREEEDEGREEEEEWREEEEEMEKDPSSTVSGPASTLPQTTSDPFEDGSSLTYVKRDVKEEFYSDISSTDDEADYFEQQQLTQGGKKRTRLHSRGFEVSASGTPEVLREKTGGNPTGSISHSYPRQTIASKFHERDRLVAVGDCNASVELVPAAEPAAVAHVQRDKSIASGELLRYSDGGEAGTWRDNVGTSCGGEAGTWRDNVGTSGGREAGTWRDNVGTSHDGPLRRLVDRANETIVWGRGSTPTEGRGSAPAVPSLQDQLVSPLTLAGPSQVGVAHPTGEGTLVTIGHATVCSDIIRAHSEVDEETTPDRMGADGEALSSGPHPSSLSCSSPHAKVPVSLAPPPSGDSQLELCVSFPLSLLNLCRETLTRLHHQGGGDHGRSGLEPGGYCPQCAVFWVWVPKAEGGVRFLILIMAGNMRKVEGHLTCCVDILGSEGLCKYTNGMCHLYRCCVCFR